MRPILDSMGIEHHTMTASTRRSSSPTAPSGRLRHALAGLPFLSPLLTGSAEMTETSDNLHVMNRAALTRRLVAKSGSARP